MKSQMSKKFVPLHFYQFDTSSNCRCTNPQPHSSWSRLKNNIILNEHREEMFGGAYKFKRDAIFGLNVV